MNILTRLFAKRRRIARRKVLSEIARKGHATRIRKQFLRDPLIREFGLSKPQNSAQPSTMGV